MVKHGHFTAPPTQPVRHVALEQYRARAQVYDSELAPFEPLRQEAIQRLRLRPGETVLDVGCGTGLSFAPLLERLGPGGRIVGIAQCPEMMDKARDLTEKRIETLTSESELDRLVSRMAPPIPEPLTPGSSSISAPEPSASTPGP